MRLKDALADANLAIPSTMIKPKKRIKKVPVEELKMRVAQATAVPRIVTDNPTEFGLIFAELDRREKKSRWLLAIGVALLSGLIGIATTLTEKFIISAH